MSDYYEVLGVSPSSDEVVIRAAYRALMRKYHPDMNGGPEAERKAREINEAFAVLSDPQRRKIYDDGRSAAYQRHSRAQTASNPKSGNRSKIEQPVAPSNSFRKIAATAATIGNSKLLNLAFILLAIFAGYQYIRPVFDQDGVFGDPLKYLNPAPGPTIIDLLDAGDLTICNRPEVIRTITEAASISFESAEKDYGTTRSEYDDVIAKNPAITNFTASDVNREISEVTCQGSGQAFLTSGIGTFVVRPSADRKSFVVVWDDNLRAILGWYKLQQPNFFQDLHPAPVAHSSPASTESPPQTDAVGEEEGTGDEEYYSQGDAEAANEMNANPASPVN